MRRHTLFGLIAILSLALPLRAQEYELPICASGEFLQIFHTIVEHQIRLDDAFASFADLMTYSRAQIANREDSLSQLPFCREAIATRRLFVQLGGDTVARAALELAALPTADNPYHQRLRSDEDRIGALAVTMLDVDRSMAPAPAERQLNACEPASMRRLDRAAASLLDLVEATATVGSQAQYVASVDRRLAWREDALARLPECADSIDVMLLMNTLATDAAAHQALAFAGVSQGSNPYAALEAEGIMRLRGWQEDRRITGAPASLVTGALPRCTLDELRTVAQSLLPYRDLATRAAALETIPESLRFGEALIAYRENQLSQLPLCAEAFAALWWVSEAIADRHAGDARADDSAEKAEAGLARITRSLDGEERLGANSASASIACGDPEMIYFSNYILPAFHMFLDAALAVSSANEVENLRERASAFRDLLWLHLPRCGEALAQGLLMRSIAADYIGMLALESSGAAAQDIPYTRAVAANIESLFDRLQQGSAFPAAAPAGNYYVRAASIANIRACGSTECAIVATVRRGEALDVLDDSGEWYEIRLPEGQVAYIAGFLVSTTRP